MTPEAKHLAEAVESLLTDGIRPSGDVVHCLNSMVGTVAPEMFNQLMAGPGNCEIETIRELVLFPDEQQQILLESHLERTVFSEVDIDDITDWLIRGGMEAALIFPDHAGKARMPVDRASMRRFIRRLKIDRPIAPGLAREIDSRFGETEMKRRLRVVLRNARFSFTDENAGFLGDFFSRIAPDLPDYMELFRFCCHMLEDTGTEEGIYAALVRHKKQCVEAIRQTRKSEQQLNQFPVEALIMKGVNICCMNIDEARRQISWIDRVSLAIFGKTERVDGQLETQLAAEPLDLGLFGNDAEDVGKLIEMLS